MKNPALTEFVASIDEELLLGQVLVRRVKGGYDLRHVADRTAADSGLRPVSLGELRAIAQATSTGEFRPLKSAPNLVAGWRARAAGDSELGAALDELYPGAVADWFAARGVSPPVTHYREFTARQTGMYRATVMLVDAQVAHVVRQCCDASRCLKRRFWTVAGLAADTAAEKSLIACLEPCAVFLEMARRAARPANDRE